jgi:hypothetical protein
LFNSVACHTNAGYVFAMNKDAIALIGISAFWMSDPSGSTLPTTGSSLKPPAEMCAPTRLRI